MRQMQRSFFLLLVLLLTAAQSFAQSGTVFKVRLSNSSPVYDFSASGIFNTPVGATEPGPIGPGGAYEFSFYAGPGSALSFTTMFVPSNDLFYAPMPAGIPLYDDSGVAVSGDVTGMVYLWDAGTELNEEPGVGPNQPMRQSGANTGDPDSDNTVRMVNDGFTYPSVSEVLRVSIDSENAPMFTVRIENVSTDSTLTPSDGSKQAVPLTPGVWVVHSAPAPLFSDGEPDRGEGLEAQAEDGAPGTLAEVLAARTGLTAHLSPGAWALHTSAAPIYTTGQPDYGMGLEAIAEDGNPGPLAMALPTVEGVVRSGYFNTPAGAEMPAPIGPGQAYEFYVRAEPGQMLSFATMFVPSNDLFIAPDEQGIALFDESGNPLSGELAVALSLLDAGTEANEHPGTGANQVQNQPGPNTGPADADNTVRPVNDGYSYPAANEVLQVSITPMETQTFTVRIENVSMPGTLTPSDSSEQAVPIAPGIWAVHTMPAPLFRAGEADRGLGLEDIAEDGNPAVLAGALPARGSVIASGVFNTPQGADSPAPVGPGAAYQFEIEAVPGARLSFATMFIPSNDLFYAPGEEGLPLFNEDGEPIMANYTGKIYLWDAGTEANEEPGVGENQAQRQSGPNTGPADADSTVRMVDDGYTYPATAQVIRVSVAPAPFQPFTLRIENISTSSTLNPGESSEQAVPLAPGIWTVHAETGVLFHEGMADHGEGLEAVAEDGNPGPISEVFAVKTQAVSSGVFNTPVDAEAPAPIGPGQAYEFTFWAAPDARLSFATMFIPSNDLFYAPPAEGLMLFDDSGTPISGDVTSMIMLWDAGTEANEKPGEGPNQAMRQSGPDTGPADSDNTVRLVNDGYSYPAVSEVIRVTLSALTTGVSNPEPAEVLTDYVLEQNYPNPFNPETVINFTLPQESRFNLAIYNLLGQRVRLLAQGVRPAGEYRATWDGRDDAGQALPSGVYIYRLETPAYSSIKKMTLLR